MDYRIKYASLGLCLGGLLLPGCRSDQNGYRVARPLAGVFSRLDTTVASPADSQSAPETTPPGSTPRSDEPRLPALEYNPPPAPPAEEQLEIVPDHQPADLEEPGPPNSIPLPTSNSRRRSGLRRLMDSWRDERKPESADAEIPLHEPVADAGDDDDSSNTPTTRVVGYEVRPLVILGLPEFDEQSAAPAATANTPTSVPPMSLSDFGHSVTHPAD